MGPSSHVIPKATRTTHHNTYNTPHAFGCWGPNSWTDRSNASSTPPTLGTCIELPKQAWGSTRSCKHSFWQPYAFAVLSSNGKPMVVPFSMAASHLGNRSQYSNKMFGTTIVCWFLRGNEALADNVVVTTSWKNLWWSREERRQHS